MKQLRDGLSGRVKRGLARIKSDPQPLWPVSGVEELLVNYNPNACFCGADYLMVLCTPVQSELLNFPTQYLGVLDHGGTGAFLA